MDNMDLEKLIDEEIETESFPGISMLVEKEGRIVFSLSKGFRQLFPSKERMIPDTMFDLASLTKPLSTAILVLNIMAQEKEDLDRRVGYFLPDVSPVTAEVSILQLLLHTSGLPPVPDIFKEFVDPENIDRKIAVKKLFSLNLTEKPGSTVIYSCTGYLLLSEILKKITGQRINELFESIITGPCGISDLLFNPGPAYVKRAASTEYCSWRKRWLRGEVHDENAYCMGGDAGNAGLFGTVKSVLEILSLFSSGGYLKNKQLLTNSGLELMTTCRTAHLNLRRSVGFLTQDEESFAGPLFDEYSFGHTGFTGTSVWIDPIKKLKVVILTNRVHFGRGKTEEKIKAFRKKIHSAIYKTF